MYINQAIRKIMKEKGITNQAMALSIGKARGNDVSARLTKKNLTFNSAVEMLEKMGYEVVIQQKKSGSRRADQVLIDQREEAEE